MKRDIDWFLIAGLTVIALAATSLVLVIVLVMAP